MSLLDFKEIAQANTNNGRQDEFEVFAARFLELCGYRILSGPSRGPDGGKDLVVEGLDGESQGKRYIVSCKHFAHSSNGKGRTVGVKDEESILERVVQHHVDGFIGFYSTELSSSFEERLFSLNKNSNHEVIWYTPLKIESVVTSALKQFRPLLVQYFPASIKTYEDRLYVNRPTGAAFQHFIADHPDVIANTHTSADGTITELKLKPDSIYQDKTILSMTFEGKDEEVEEKVRRLKSGNWMEIKTGSFKFHEESPIGQWMASQTSESGKLYLQALSTKIPVSFDIVVTPASTQSDRRVVLSSRPSTIHIHPTDSVEWKSANAGSQSYFSFEVRFALDDKLVPIHMEFNWGLKGETTESAQQILEAHRLLEDGAILKFFDHATGQKLLTINVEYERINPYPDELHQALHDLQVIEDKTECRFIFPEISLIESQYQWIRTIKELVTTGQTVVYPQKSIEIPLNSSQEVLPEIPENSSLDLTVTWNSSQPEKFKVLDQSIEIGHIHRQFNGWQSQVEERFDVGGQAYTMLILSPDTSSEMQMYCLNFLPECEESEYLATIPPGMLRTEWAIYQQEKDS